MKKLNITESLNLLYDMYESIDRIDITIDKLGIHLTIYLNNKYIDYATTISSVTDSIEIENCDVKFCPKEI